MATNAEVKSDVTLYGTVVIPAYVEKHDTDVLSFSKPRYIKMDVCIVIVSSALKL